jgi:hypothetical protein
MNKLQKTFLALFVCFLLAVPVWRFWVVPELLKLSSQYTNSLYLNALSDTRHSLNSDWSGETIVKAAVQESTLNTTADTQTIKGHFQKKTLAGDVLWETDNVFVVDRYTNKILEGNQMPVLDSYYLFPKGTQQKQYRVWPKANNNLYDFQFNESEEVFNLEVFRFTAKDVVVDDTEGFKWLELVPSTYSVKSVQTIDVWIEPVTGVMVSMRDIGTSHYADPESGELVYAMQKWDNKFNDDTIANQVRLAQNEKQKIHLYERWVPLLLSLLSFAFLIALFASRNLAISAVKPQPHE